MDRKVREGGSPNVGFTLEVGIIALAKNYKNIRKINGILANTRKNRASAASQK